jgi:hypothetical protein
MLSGKNDRMIYLNILGWVVMIHSLTFILEAFYQRFCAPISLVGYFTSMITSPSLVCKATRDMSADLILFTSFHLKYVILWFCFKITSSIRVRQYLIRVSNYLY